MDACHIVGDRIVAGPQCMAHAISVHGAQPITIQCCETGKVCRLPAPADGWTEDQIKRIASPFSWYLVTLGCTIVADSEV